ncbi:hypothetical protein FB451DRAFT_1376109 [Mycena latifolia]|nr:hypothetical protein FB451DRAFT_1376109 [Mycena latifolia]
MASFAPPESERCSVHIYFSTVVVMGVQANDFGVHRLLRSKGQCSFSGSDARKLKLLCEQGLKEAKSILVPVFWLAWPFDLGLILLAPQMTVLVTPTSTNLRTLFKILGKLQAAAGNFRAIGGVSFTFVVALSHSPRISSSFAHFCLGIPPSAILPLTTIVMDRKWSAHFSRGSSVFFASTSHVCVLHPHPLHCEQSTPRDSHPPPPASTRPNSIMTFPNGTTFCATVPADIPTVTADESISSDEGTIRAFDARRTAVGGHSGYTVLLDAPHIGVKGPRSRTKLAFAGLAYHDKHPRAAAARYGQLGENPIALELVGAGPLEANVIVAWILHRRAVAALSGCSWPGKVPAQEVLEEKALDQLTELLVTPNIDAKRRHLVSGAD